MKWNEIQKEFPNKFVLLKTRKYHIDGNTKVIDDVDLVEVIDDPKEASRILIRCKGDNFIFHTNKARLAMDILVNQSFRRIDNDNNI